MWQWKLVKLEPCSKSSLNAPVIIRIIIIVSVVRIYKIAIANFKESLKTIPVFCTVYLCAARKFALFCRLWGILASSEGTVDQNYKFWSQADNSIITIISSVIVTISQSFYWYSERRLLLVLAKTTEKLMITETSYINILDSEHWDRVQVSWRSLRSSIFKNRGSTLRKKYNIEAADVANWGTASLK